MQMLDVPLVTMKSVVNCYELIFFQLLASFLKDGKRGERRGAKREKERQGAKVRGGESVREELTGGALEMVPLVANHC